MLGSIYDYRITCQGFGALLSCKSMKCHVFFCKIFCLGCTSIRLCCTCFQCTCPSNTGLTFFFIIIFICFIIMIRAVLAYVQLMCRLTRSQIYSTYASYAASCYIRGIELDNEVCRNSCDLIPVRRRVNILGIIQFGIHNNPIAEEDTNNCGGTVLCFHSGSK